MRALIALLLAASAWAEVPLDRVQWSPEFGVPTTAGLAGRQRYVLIFDRKDPGAGTAHDRFSWYMHNTYTREPMFVASIIGVDAAFNPPAEDKPEPYARGMDDGSLLRSFAGEGVCAMLVFAPDGTLTQIRDAAGVDDTWLHTLAKLAQAAEPTPLIDAGMVTPALTPAFTWYLVGDLKRCLAKMPAGDPATAQLPAKAKAMVEADIAAMKDTQKSGGARLMALLRLRAWAAEFPPVAKEANAAVKAVKDDAALKAEQAAWAAWLDYLAAMKKVKGKQAAQAQPGLLAGLVAKHPDSYAAHVARTIAAFAKIALPEGKQPKE